ncbi:hypothetical protein B0T17DRAFT_613453 [Bombardia bombarda]|uniref:DUF6594 domain-containing protein n=1 Tax=Bombardia bombarda TaxID=252184 RepID=A0AA40CFD6_9PEZI|nr:hypothetical protein B0T17DRAFT_613453 [Bombardia bombarda]
MGAGSDTWGDFNEIKELDEEQKRNWVKYMKGLMKDLWPLIKHLVVARERPVRDLVTVHRRKAGDTSLLTRWVTEEWIPFYHNHIRCSHPVESNEDPRYISAKRYSQSSILRFTAFVTMVAACLLPTVAIGVLTTAQTTLQKLGYIAGFTALFSIGVMWLTDASTSRIQVFTATAAFSAVLVVFVQGQ